MKTRGPFVRAALSLAALVLSLSLVVARPARADSEGGAAAAESLFQEARKLMDAKNYKDACPKFAASQKLSPAIGTLLNLADCYERNNQLASAWARFHEAIALAQRLNRTNREQTARDRADKLEPRLIKLTILAHASGLDVKLDGNAIDPAVLGTPIPVDAGHHTVEATAKNKKPFSKDIEVSEKLKNPSVDIPPLEDDTSASKEPAGAGGGSSSKFTEPPKDERGGGGWPLQKTLGVVAMGVGAVGIGVGTVFGIKTQSTWRDAQSHCSEDLQCDAEGVDLAGKAKSSGNLATVAFVAGGVLAAGGLVLFFTAPRHAKSSASSGARQDPLRVGLGAGSLILRGVF